MNESRNVAAKKDMETHGRCECIMLFSDPPQLDECDRCRAVREAAERQDPAEARHQKELEDRLNHCAGCRAVLSPYDSVISCPCKKLFAHRKCFDKHRCSKPVRQFKQCGTQHPGTK